MAKLKDRMAANAAVRDNGLSSLLGTNAMKELSTEEKKIREIPLEKLHPFSGHTFKVTRNTDFESTVDSVREHGILIPLVVRPHPTLDSEYEIIAGHRRCAAAKEVALHTVPCLVLNISDAEAKKDMVESNIQRPEWLPSEKAQSYRLWMDAVREEGGIRAGRPASGNGDTPVRASEVACKRFGISARTLDMYVKLNDCVEDILTLCDAGRITVTAAYQVSFLPDEQQMWVVQKLMADPTRTLSEADAKTLRYKYEGREPVVPAPTPSPAPAPAPAPVTPAAPAAPPRAAETERPQSKLPPVAASHRGPVLPPRSGHSVDTKSFAASYADDLPEYHDDSVPLTAPADAMASLSWQPIAAAPEGSLKNGVRIMFTLDGDDLERDLLDKVVCSENHALLERIRESILEELRKAAR